MAGKPKQPERCSRCGRACSTLYQAGPPKRTVVDGHVRTVRVWLCEPCAKEIGVKQNCPGEAHKHLEGPDRCSICAPDWNVVIKHPLPLRDGYYYVEPWFNIGTDAIYILTCHECGAHPETGQHWHQIHPLKDPLDTTCTHYICGACERRLREAEARQRNAQFT